MTVEHNRSRNGVLTLQNLSEVLQQPTDMPDHFDEILNLSEVLQQPTDMPDHFDEILNLSEVLQQPTIFGCLFLHKYTLDGSVCVTEYVWGTCVDLRPGYLFIIRTLAEVEGIKPANCRLLLPT